MSFFNTYKQWLNVQGGSIQGLQKETLKQSILNSFYDSPSYYQVYINNSTTPQDVWIVDDSDTKDLIRIITKPNDNLFVGDLVNWNGNYWLVLLVDDMGGIYKRGSIQLCNSSLKWKDSTNTLFSHSCIITSPVQSDVLNENQYLTTIKGVIRIICQYNNDTKNIKRDQRFIFGSSVYKVSHIDDFSKIYNGVGLLNLTLDITESNVNDDFQEGVADNSHLYGNSGGGNSPW